MDAESAIVIAAIGAAPGLLGLGGFNATWFSDYQNWFCLALVMSNLSHREATERLPAVPGIIRGAIIIVLLINVLANTVIWMNFTLNRNLVSRGVDNEAIERDTGVHLRNTDLSSLKTSEGREHFVADLNALTEAVDRKMKHDEILTGLLELSRMTPEEKRQTALHIPHSNTRYWRLLDANPEWIGKAPEAFLAPALTRIAMIDGLPPVSFRGNSWFRQEEPLDILKYYSFECYGKNAIEERSQRPRLSLNELRERAKEKGFQRLFIIDLDDKGSVKVEKYDCP